MHSQDLTMFRSPCLHSELPQTDRTSSPHRASRVATHDTEVGDQTPAIGRDEDGAERTQRRRPIRAEAYRALLLSMGCWRDHAPRSVIRSWPSRRAHPGAAKALGRTSERSCSRRAVTTTGRTLGVWLSAQVWPRTKACARGHHGDALS